MYSVHAFCLEVVSHNHLELWNFASCDSAASLTTSAQPYMYVHTYTLTHFRLPQLHACMYYKKQIVILTKLLHYLSCKLVLGCCHHSCGPSEAIVVYVLDIHLIHPI